MNMPSVVGGAKQPSRTRADTDPVVLERKVIMPGEHLVSWDPVEIVTLLGSCVAACIYDAHRKIGGMNHFMLPDIPSVAPALTDQTKPLRYGLYAMERVINDLLMMGAKREHLVAKVFGGANMTNTLENQHVGRRNAQFVIEFLRRDKIRVLASDLGGINSRRIRFNTRTNAVRVERVASADQLALRQDRQYRDQIQADPVDGEVIFF
ncbi:chemoreceptor glutamine deamidase CheD [Limnobacter humi]|uniref:Probable chemoreceptor glutamine deamidase CheD n=1 Tax=Limnobacter humi TaxID=1778671 RepID=A0ABT1WK66_9BURK|nr:chemoreceptor glutamine deamidase CheD [Limnobacter humi]MCQ8897353.1 chemoreceptor glutamine deamidase CheD [Limnobacter humi]